ncbi:hypothetical protein [Streptomyces sp. CB02613]|uniref:hypothetical protein n=1 Tax=Streptomyces sp. CB02613 TaxID=2020328 RepID=UPI00131A682D|nr:hypothetical protein [Streptomyces sp. CB02613]
MQQEQLLHEQHPCAARGPPSNVIALQHLKDTVQQGVLHSREHKQHQEQREVMVGC